MKFIELDEPEYTCEPLYDLFDGGSIRPENILTDQEDIDKVNEAIEVIRQYLDEAEEAGCIEIG